MLIIALNLGCGVEKATFLHYNRLIKVYLDILIVFMGVYMNLEYIQEKTLDKFFEAEAQKLELVYYSPVLTNHLFNYHNQVVYYRIALSARYGIHMFIIFELTMTELENNFVLITNIVQNCLNIGKRQLTRYRMGNVDFHVHGYFPSLDPEYFTESLLSDLEEYQLINRLKAKIPSALPRIMEPQTFLNAFKMKDSHNQANRILKEKENILRVKGIFTHETAPDMSLKTKLNLDNRSSQRMEYIYERFELDDDQKHKVESFNLGHRLLLAEAGTGKSVILFLKAQRLAALNPEAKILILAFNRYLVEEFIRKREFENIKAGVIEIFTIDKFLNYLVQKHLAHIEYDDFDKDAKVKDLLQIIGRLEKYDAIYIDEVQQFEASWLKLCYNLLKSHEPDAHSFVLCGDINQTTRSGKKNPWRDADIPSFAGRRTTLTTKYRSTPEINQFVDAFVKNVYTLALRNNLPLIEEIESNSLYTIEYNEGDRLEDISTFAKNDVRFFKTPFSLEERIPVLADYIASLSSEIDLRDAIILTPYTKAYRQPFIEMLKAALLSRDINVVAHSDENYLVYQDLKDHLSIVTVQRCVGLDFKYVILVGLDLYGYDHKNNIKMYYEDGIATYDIDEFNKDLSTLYVALTRAKSKLFIENTAAIKRNSIVERLIFGDPS